MTISIASSCYFLKVERSICFTKKGLTIIKSAQGYIKKNICLKSSQSLELEINNEDMNKVTYRIVLKSLKYLQLPEDWN